MLKLIPLLAVAWSFCSHGQSEQFFKKLYHLNEQRGVKQFESYTWQAWGQVFRYDLNDDGLAEGLQIAKKDHQNWLYLYDNRGGALASYQFTTLGRNSGLYRVKLNKLAQGLKLLSLYFYDGLAASNELYATATLYFITFDSKDLKKMHFSKGPAVWIENKTLTGYRQRSYQIKLEDIDHDGTKEVIVRHGHIQRIFRYTKGHGMQKLAL